MQEIDPRLVPLRSIYCKGTLWEIRSCNFWLEFSCCLYYIVNSVHSCMCLHMSTLTFYEFYFPCDGVNCQFPTLLL